jgi:putative aldouronate transport system substrate-binding protein
MLAIIMVFSLCMTACSTEEKPEAEAAEGEEGEADKELQRKNTALTIYAITDSKTTEEGLKAVEKKISQLCVAKYKTAIQLRFCTAEEYQAKLNAMYDQFAAQEAAKLQAEKEAAEKLKSEAAYKATLSKEEKQKFEQQKRLEEMAKKEEAERLAKEEAEKIAAGEDVAQVKDVQMDIIYIPSQKDYAQNIEQGLLLDLRPYLDGKFKVVTDYVFPSYITAATVNNSIYGIPTNKGISTNETYLLVNTALATKYNVDLASIRSITDLEDAYAKAKAEGVAPIYGDFDPEGAYLLDGEGFTKAVCVYTDTLLGAKFSGTNLFTSINPNGTNSMAMLDHFKLKAEYKQKGYFSANSQNFFASVQELTDEEKAEWEKKGYTAVLYKGANFTDEAALEDGLFGISKYCEEPERAMEILQLIYTDAEMRNLLAYGVQDVNYIVRADIGNNDIITIVDTSYTMDFFKTGNTLIGYLPDTMDPEYINRSKEKNLNSFTNPLLGFWYEMNSEEVATWKENAKAWEEYLAPYWEKLENGTADYKEILTQIYNELYNETNDLFGDASLKDFFTASADNKIRDNYKAHTEKLIALDTVIHFEESVSTPLTAESK